MPIIREPDGVEFTVVPVTLTAKDRREISQYIANYRQTHDQSDDLREANEVLALYEERQTRTAPKLKDDVSIAERSSQLRNGSASIECLPKDCEANACAIRERIEAEALSLPAAERTLLVHRLVDSLVIGEARLPEPVIDQSGLHQAPQAVTRRKAAQSRPARRKAAAKKPVTASAR